MNVLLPYRKMDIGISAVHILEYLVKRTNKLWKEANTKNDVHNKFLKELNEKVEDVQVMKTKLKTCG